MSTKTIEGFSALDRGNKAHREKDFAKAIVLFNSAIDSYSKAEQNENTKKNIEVAKNNLSIAWNDTGLAELNTNNIKEAITAFKNATEQNPNSLAAHYNLGLAYEKGKDLDNAIVAYKSSLALMPKSDTAKVIETHCKIIECTQQQKDTNASHTVLKDAYQCVSGVEKEALQPSANKVNFILEQYGKSCISVNVKDSKEIDSIENLYKSVNPSKTLWSVLRDDMYAQYTDKSGGQKAETLKLLVDGLLKQCGYLAKNDKDAGVLEGMKTAAGLLASQLPDHTDLVHKISSAESCEALVPVLGAVDIA